MKYAFLILLIFSGMKSNSQDFCSEIITKVDDLDDSKNIYSPLIDGLDLSSAVLYKDIAKGKTVYYLRLRTYGSTVNVNEKGVIVLFTDGTKWNKPSAEIDLDTDRKGYEYSCFIQLSSSDLTLFKSKTIKKFRLYIYDETLEERFAESFKEYVNCIIKAK